jgi:NAD(P)-dependent dehydrogenase (short-subunit alcohol dehydrogenase family)
VGSIGMLQAFGQVPAPAYKVSKTALNMLTALYGLDYGKQGFTVVALSPGVPVYCPRMKTQLTFRSM